MMSSSKSGGPVPKFNDYHIWKTLNSLDSKTPVGRKKLSSLLDIGEGSTRTIISILQEHQLISVDKNGIVLTDEGVSLKKKTHMDVANIKISDLTIGEVDVAVRVPKMARNVKYGCEERDAAIKSGAAGATTLMYSGGKLVFPGSDYPVDTSLEAKVKKVFSLKNDDVVVIGTGHDRKSAEIGAVVAGITIMGGLRINRGLNDILSAKSTDVEIVSLAFAIHDLVGGLPVCAKSRNNLGIRIENGAVIDNAYTGAILEEAMISGTTIRRVATSGPYTGTRVIVTPIELDNRTIAVIGVVDIRSMAGIDSIIRRYDESDDASNL